MATPWQRWPSTRVLTRKTPFSGALRRFNWIFAVGEPSWRPSFCPCSTQPLRLYARPSSRSAVCRSPAASTSRTRELLTRMPSITTVVAASTVKPSDSPALARKSKSPERSQPKRKSSPTSRWRTFSPSTSTWWTNSAAESSRKRRLNGRQRTKSTPCSRSSSSFSRSRVRRTGAASGAKNSRGCGSKITTQLGMPSSSERSRRRPRIAW
ncbi:hypothetical protein D9M71_548380 [compost metagenome]